MFPKTLAILCVLGAGLARAGDSELRGPVMGYLADANGSVRPLLGIPGAALIGRPLDLPVSLSVAAVSPKQDYVIGSTAQDRRTVLIRLAGTDRSPQSIENARAGITRIIASPAGGTVALYFKDTAVVQVLTGLPDAPKVSYEFEVPDEVGAIAVSADGERVLYAVTGQDTGAVFLRASSGELTRMAGVRSASALAFSENGPDIAIADAAANEVWIGHGGALQRLAGEREGIVAPGAVAFSPRGILVASAGNKAVALVPQDGSAIRFTACPCTPDSLSLLGNGMFQLTASAKGTIYVFDAGAAEPAVWFIPALVEANAGDVQ
jgi:hypothetical protein